MGTINENNTAGRVKAVCISKEKGTKKKAVSLALFKENFGIVDDAHAGSPRQVSLLSEESVQRMRAKGLDAAPGDFAENILSEGIDLRRASAGTKIKIGEGVILEVTQVGKVCRSRCAIYHAVGDCIMPKEGLFAKVLAGGAVKTGDTLEILFNSD